MLHDLKAKPSQEQRFPTSEYQSRGQLPELTWGWASRHRHVKELRPDLTQPYPVPDPAELSMLQPWYRLETVQAEEHIELCVHEAGKH